MRLRAGRPALRAGVVVVTMTAAATATVVLAQRMSVAAAVETYPMPASGTITVSGHGNGHGHGLSQYGAKGAALAGLTPAQITSFYYPGTTAKVLGSSTIRVQISGTGTTTVVAASPGISVTGVGALSTTGVSKFRLVAPSGVTTLRLDKLVGSTWSTVKSGIANGAEFSRSAGTIRLYFSNATSTVYRGAIRVLRNGTGTWSVNRVSLDGYTEGVVPREMPASWPAAAVQAQAIAARSYGRQAVESDAANPWDICDTTQCQVYGGMTHYDSAGNVLWTDDPAALTGNANTVLQYAGATIFAQFSASNGGWTVDGGKPYLVAKADPYDNAASGDPYLNWTRTPSVSSIASYYGLKQVTSILITQRDGNGQWGGRVLAGAVKGITSTGASTQISTTGFDLQAALGLPHNWFVIQAANAPPRGHLDRVDITASRTFTAYGWSYDPNHPDLPGQVRIQVDGATPGAATATAIARPDVQRVYGLSTALVGFGLPVKVSPGSHSICVLGQDQDSSATVKLGCITATMPDQIGSVDVLSAGTGSVHVAGWALDPDHKDLPGSYRVVLDGVAGAATDTSIARSDIQRIYGTTTASYGYDRTLPLAAGSHRVCVESLDRDGGTPVSLRCATVTVT